MKPTSKLHEKRIGNFMKVIAMQFYRPFQIITGLGVLRKYLFEEKHEELKNYWFNDSHFHMSQSM